MNGGAGMTSHAQLVCAGVVLHCMDPLLFPLLLMRRRPVGSAPSVRSFF